MKHKIKIWRDGIRLWYLECACNWQPDTKAESVKHGGDYYGRDTWDAALALGVAHQQNVNGRGEESG